MTRRHETGKFAAPKGYLLRIQRREKVKTKRTKLSPKAGDGREILCVVLKI
jgi:hypothetical protein